MKRLGLDFDNTLIIYNELFHKLAHEDGLIDKDFPKSKKIIRQYLIDKDLEDKFTELQGEVYGSRITEAKESYGMIDALKKIKDGGFELYIISHKTQFPYAGKKYDLREAALKWMQSRGFFNKEILNFNRNQIFFENTKEAKVARIKDLQCSHYIDDLPQILKMLSGNCCRILADFDLNYKTKEEEWEYKLNSWKDLSNILNEQ